MGRLADYPQLTALAALAALAAATYLGGWIAHLRPVKSEAARSHLSQITGAAISILALLLGFSYSASINRYDQRKNCEQEEASAISSEYTLAALLPDADAAELRGLLRQLVTLRIAYYETYDTSELASVRDERLKVEAAMWPIVARNAKANQTAIMGQVVGGMDKVLSRPGYSQAAANDRIPDAVWTLLAVLSACCCGLLGYLGHGRQGWLLRLVVPVFVAISFFVIATLDSQRRGVIRVLPENLIRVQGELE